MNVRLTLMEATALAKKKLEWVIAERAKRKAAWKTREQARRTDWARMFWWLEPLTDVELEDRFENQLGLGETIALKHYAARELDTVQKVLLLCKYSADGYVTLDMDTLRYLQ